MAIIIQQTSGSLWQYYRDEQNLTDVGAIANFPAADNNSTSFKFIQKKQVKQMMVVHT